MKQRTLLIAAGTTLAAALLAGSAAAARLTKPEYLVKLRAADAISSRADNHAIAALRSRTSTAAQVRAAFYAMGKTHVRIGHEFATITPPRAATGANQDFAHAEILFGRQNEAIALRLPKTKAALRKFLQSLKPPSGGRLLDHAIAELHAAGFTLH